MLCQPRTQALHCFYRDQRQLIIQARKGVRSTRNEGSANLVPRLFLRGRKDPGRSWSRDAYKIDCLRGYGQSVKLRTLPLLDFTLPLQGVSVLYNRL